MEPLGRDMDKPCHPEYSECSKRVGSFGNWPSTKSQTAHELAVAGFFYTGMEDCVKCFFCGEGLKDWEDDDIPWVEHANNFPRCAFVQKNHPELVKGRNEVARKQSFTSGPGSSGYGTLLKDVAFAGNQSQDGKESCRRSDVSSSGISLQNNQHHLNDSEQNGRNSSNVFKGPIVPEEGSTTLVSEESHEKEITSTKTLHPTSVSLKDQSGIPCSPICTTTGEHGHAHSENIEFSLSESIESGAGQNDESMQLSEENLSLSHISLNSGTSEPGNEHASITSESISSTCRVFNSQGNQSELADSESPLSTLADEQDDSERGEVPDHSQNTSSPSPIDQLLIPLANPRNENIGQQTRISSQHQTEAANVPFQITQESRNMLMHHILLSFMGSMANQMTNNENTGQQTSIPQLEAANMHFEFIQESWRMCMRQLSVRFIGSTANQMPFMNILNYALPYAFHQLANNPRGPHVQCTEVPVESHPGLIVNENNVTVREVQAVQEGDDFIDLHNVGHITDVVRNYVQNSPTLQNLGPNLEIRRWP